MIVNRAECTRRNNAPKILTVGKIKICKKKKISKKTRLEYNICPHHAWTTVPMKNDVNKVNAAFCGMRFQQYRTSLTMFYWKSPLEILWRPRRRLFFLYFVQTRDDYGSATAVTHTLVVVSICVWVGVWPTGAHSRLAQNNVRKTRIWELLGGLSRGRTRRKTCGQRVTGGASSRGHDFGSETSGVGTHELMWTVNAPEMRPTGLDCCGKTKTENATFREKK